MAEHPIHLPWDGLAGSTRAACGQTGRINTATDRDAVTCARCKRTRKWKEGLVPQSEKEQTEPSWLSPEQDEAVTFERRATRFEVMAFIREGDLSAAQFRMQRGFERQCRLAGLDRAVRESREKEMVDA